MTTTDTGERLAGHLDQASEHVRAANHVALGQSIPLNDAYTVAGRLDELVRRLPQLVGYLAHTVERAGAAAYYDDRGRDPGPTIRAAADALAGALAGLDAIGTHTAAAHNALSHLGQRRHEED